MKIGDPRVSANIGELSSVLAKVDDPALIGAFLQELLTPAETADVAARGALVKALKENIPQREIAKDLGISLCKITRGSRELKKQDSAFNKLMKG